MWNDSDGKIGLYSEPRWDRSPMEPDHRRDCALVSLNMLGITTSDPLSVSGW
jgi:hypothetical protein